MRYKINFFLIIIISVFTAQFTLSQVEENDKIELTGNLHADSKIILSGYSQLNSNPLADDLPGKKSPVLAGVLSAILPGAGQFYNEDYWVAGVFFIVEAALVTTAVVYDNKGDEQTTSFEEYADQNWSVVDYAQWLADYKEADYSKIVVSDDESLPPWERVDWNELNAAETGSHKLPPHGGQQYYELIGKYHQYSSGWNDYAGGSNNELISPNFTYYAGERGEANDYYSTASTAVIGVYINHILSAAEAVWGATRFNKNLAVNIRVETYNLAGGSELVPTLKVKFSF